MKMGSKRFLVTGGSGFIGSALTRRLVAEGHSVRVFDNNSRGSAHRLRDVKRDIEFVEADIRDLDAVTSATRDIDTVIHLAYVNGTEFFYSKPELVLDIAIRGMLNVIDACRSNGCGDLILASSSEVYQTPAIIPTDERTPLLIPDVTNPRYSYGGGKILCELMGMHYGVSSFDRVTIFRPHNVYGVDMGWEHVIPQLSVKTARLIKSNLGSGIKPLVIQGDGTQTRAFVHIDDFVDGVMLLLAEGRHREIYHIGNEEEVTISKVANLIASTLGYEAKLEYGQAKPGGTLRRCPDTSKMRDLGYAPKISFAEGIVDVANWYSAHEHLAPPDESAA